MKIIDILNKIANGEEVPIEINYKDTIYRYDCDTKDYYSGLNVEYLLDSYSIPTILNDEVEILDEPKENKIEKLVLYHDDYSYSGNTETDITRIENKINELIDEVNKLI